MPTDVLFPSKPNKGATVSPCGLYRYDLWRRWSDVTNGTGRTLGWVMLNPSTGDADRDDATIRRCMGYARRDGFGGIVIRNLFAYRTPDPKVLTAAYRDGVDVAGPENDDWLRRLTDDCAMVVLAWGQTKTPAFRHDKAMHALRILSAQADRWLKVDDGRGSFAPHPCRLKTDDRLLPI